MSLILKGWGAQSMELSIMLSKIAIGLAAAAIAMGGSTLSASAMHGGGGGGPHGGKVSGFGPHGGGRGYAMTYRHGPDHWRGRYGYRYYGGYRYGGGSCWRWTPEGRVWVCGGGYGPSYRYGSYRGGGWGYRPGGRGLGPHGGGRHFR
jgi:hypothetical protein